MKSILVFSVCILLLASLSLGVAQEAVVLVTHSAIAASSMTKQKIAELYDGSSKLIGDTEARLYTLPADHPATLSFYKTVLNMTPQAFNQHWLKKMFAGGGSPPAKISSVQELIKVVSSTPGAVGFVSQSEGEKASGCRVIRVE